MIMVHPDYQYTPKLIPAMASLIGNGLYHCVLGSRILGGQALKGGMPSWKYLANRFLTLSRKPAHRGETVRIPHRVPCLFPGASRADSVRAQFRRFRVDNQMLAQVIWLGHTIGEISCPAKYFEDASSINFSRSLRYGFGCLGTGFTLLCARLGLVRVARFPSKQ